MPGRGQIESIEDRVERLEEIVLTLTPKTKNMPVQGNAAFLLQALVRIASTEAFTMARPLDPERDDELLARIQYAREIVKEARRRKHWSTTKPE